MFVSTQTNFNQDMTNSQVNFITNGMAGDESISSMNKDLSASASGAHNNITKAS